MKWLYYPTSRFTFSINRWTVYVKEEATETPIENITEDTISTKWLRMLANAGAKHCRCSWNQYGVNFVHRLNKEKPFHTEHKQTPMVYWDKTFSIEKLWFYFAFAFLFVKCEPTGVWFIWYYSTLNNQWNRCIKPCGLIALFHFKFMNVWKWFVCKILHFFTRPVSAEKKQLNWH